MKKVSYNFRKAQLEDKEEILSISDNFNHDYLPYVIDRWLTMGRGGLYLLEESNKIVACCLLKFQTSNQAWLAGMRVRPDYHNLGAGGELTGRLTERANYEGANIVRFVTNLDNYPAQKVGEKHGFYFHSRWMIFYYQDLPHNITTTFDIREEMFTNQIDKTSRELFFQEGFTFAELTNPQFENIDDKDRFLLNVKGEVAFIGENTENFDKEVTFFVNCMVLLEQLEKIDFYQVIKELLSYLNKHKYYACTLPIPYELWKQDRDKLGTLLGKDEGESFI
ncbi:GNAT family N-acetyltransferase [Natranaerobius trueperi]|uniref:N-acetyltransferase domain-containing protein n=1 Tax=Natranaerobius trueperi TaxID=759412 RepID=A0A226C151_9FIRM|nr:GNAT family N-acetyltransferase [Natranaerobius trueperi]OWZ84946.1 hypothetical protein CDO51_00640 [Natranaerobius trueperi]